jgi:hypothetical protein
VASASDSTVASASDSTVASASDSQDGAGAAAVAAAAVAGKQKSTNIKGSRKSHPFFCYSIFELDANMMLRDIDMKPELESHTGKED